jgi:hypothetical protein
MPTLPDKMERKKKRSEGGLEGLKKILQLQQKIKKRLRTVYGQNAHPVNSLLLFLN